MSARLPGDLQVRIAVTGRGPQVQGGGHRHRAGGTGLWVQGTTAGCEDRTIHVSCNELLAEGALCRGMMCMAVST